MVRPLSTTSVLNTTGKIAYIIIIFIRQQVIDRQVEQSKQKY